MQVVTVHVVNGDPGSTGDGGLGGNDGGGGTGGEPGGCCGTGGEPGSLALAALVAAFGARRRRGRACHGR